QFSGPAPQRVQSHRRPRAGNIRPHRDHARCHVLFRHIGSVSRWCARSICSHQMAATRRPLGHLRGPLHRNVLCGEAALRTSTGGRTAASSRKTDFRRRQEPDLLAKNRHTAPMKWLRALALPAAALGAVAIKDLTQRRHAILRNFPVIGHGRYLLESIGPELRQYITTNNDEERPFSRDQRRWVYASAKRQNNYFGFGTDMDVEFEEGYPILKHRTFSGDSVAVAAHADAEATIPAAKVVGAARGRAKAFRPQSVVNISAMS